MKPRPEQAGPRKLQEMDRVNGSNLVKHLSNARLYVMDLPPGAATSFLIHQAQHVLYTSLVLPEPKTQTQPSLSTVRLVTHKPPVPKRTKTLLK